ncbi:MAG: META domain-containing protein [Phycisphaeraceae bacterium]|nr:META domain-containing protein [Phycisphaeraceae bacterium]MBX3366275.1 META domain-containing protein [Phycisphaeraceae bacterium]QYK48731.1 MAG: META domain-containing protein [Phycisphaeraceae bacterium]
MHLARIVIIGSALSLPLAITSLTGCQSGQSMTDSASMIQKLTGDWNLTALRGADLSTIMPQGLRVPSLSFTEDGKVSGTGGINRLASSIDLEALAKGEFKLAPTASTKMAGSPEAMNFEDSFLKALGEATGLSVKGDTLSLSNAAGELMKFARAK